MVNHNLLNILLTADCLAIMLTVAALTFGLVALCSLHRVSESEWMVVERLGRVNRIVSGGLFIVWPWLDRVRPVHWRAYNNNASHQQSTSAPAPVQPLAASMQQFFGLTSATTPSPASPAAAPSLASSASSLHHQHQHCSTTTTTSGRIPRFEQVLDQDPVQVTTSDTVVCWVDPILYYSITDVHTTIRSTDDLHVALVEFAKVHLPRACAGVKFHALLANVQREVVDSKGMAAEMRRIELQYGLRLRVEIQRVTASPEMMRAHEQTIIALREAETSMQRAQSDLKVDAVQQERQLQRRRTDALALAAYHKLLREQGGLGDEAILRYAQLEAWNATMRGAKHSTVVVPGWPANAYASLPLSSLVSVDQRS